VLRTPRVRAESLHAALAYSDLNTREFVVL
jgi:hypothetical protein